jgi:hypothetical protein
MMILTIILPLPDIAGHGTQVAPTTLSALLPLTH